jgi:hypothetical protein
MHLTFEKSDSHPLEIAKPGRAALENFLGLMSASPGQQRKDLGQTNIFPFE